MDNDPFFQKPQRKRKASGKQSSGKESKKRVKLQKKEERDEVGFDAVAEEIGEKSNKRKREESEEFEEVNENEDEKRLRLAMKYLEKFQRDSDDDDSDTEKQLQEEMHKKSGRYHQKVARFVQENPVDASKIRRLKGPTLSVTCTALTSDDTTIFCGSKDASIFRFDVETGKKFRLKGGKKEQGGDYLRDEVLSVAVSSDGLYLASAGLDSDISLWDTRSLSIIRKFQGHKNPVSCLKFRHGTYDLYSGSFDRTVKLWNVGDLSYIDTLFGHQSEITDLDCLSRECALTSSMDRTLRLWKIVDETQLLFKGTQSASIDCVRMLNEDHWISGGQDGSLSLWHSRKKKQIAFVKNAASMFPISSDEPTNSWPGSGTPWISSVASCVRTDLVASGSATGHLGFWQANFIGTSKHSLLPIQSVPLGGFINSLDFSQSKKFIVAGVGHEHKFGRWFRDPTGKNGVAVIPLPSME